MPTTMTLTRPRSTASPTSRAGSPSPSPSSTGSSRGHVGPPPVSISSSDSDASQSTSRKRKRPSPALAEPLLPIQPLPSRINRKQTTDARAAGATQAANATAPDGFPTTTHRTIETTNSNFSSLGVQPWLVTSLKSLAITRPTTIQKACIPKILEGRDCIGGSRTGSGKTVAFAVPILQKWAEDPIGVFAVVLTPTRELALQIFEQISAISSPQSLKALLIVGGNDSRAQALALATRPHIVIATPGRLADHILNSGADTTRGLSRVQIVVLDEADRLLASGPGSMLPDLSTCLSAFPPAATRQTLLFTATLTPEVLTLEAAPRASGKPPIYVHTSQTTALSVPSTLKQKYIQVPVTHRECYLHILLQTPSHSSLPIIVFCNRTSTAELLEHILRHLSHRVTSLHSRLPQFVRTSNLSRFRANAARILIATDVAARGLDIPDVALVINYDVPRDPDDYIHRVGRTARAGRKGTSITCVGQRDIKLILAIEERTGGKMEEFSEEGVNIEGRVVRDAIKSVGEAKRMAALEVEEGREVGGKRKRGGLKSLMAVER